MIECCICCETIAFNNADENVCATNCGHVFHDGCLRDWLTRSGTCPHCRAVLKETDCIRLYMNNGQRAPNAQEKLSEDEIKRLTQLKGTIQSAIVSMERLYAEVDKISAAKTSGKESITLCADIRKKLLRDQGATCAAAGNSSVVDITNTQKKISDALGHIAVFEEKMFVANKSLTDLAAQLHISGGAGDRNKYTFTHAKSFPSVGNAKRNFY